MSMYLKGIEIGALAESYEAPGFAEAPPQELITYADRDVEIGAEKPKTPLAEAGLFIFWVVGIPTVFWLATK